ncbi:MAG: hypothetical protein ABEJ30_01920 [Halorientalis sp.]
MRAVSTVLDTGLFLLLVGAAMLTLTLPVGTLPTADAAVADGTGDVIATTTADVRYTLAPGGSEVNGSVVAFPDASGPGFRRTAHGTLATHLAAAAVASLTVGGERVSHSRDGFRDAVRNATAAAVRNRDQLVRVRAVWRPYPGAPVRGVVHVGPRPPPSVAVHTATLTVDSGLPATRGAAVAAAASGGYQAVGRTVSRHVVAGLFPPNATRSALLGDYPTEHLAASRYHRLAAALGANLGSAVRRDDPASANTALTSALGARFAADMRERFRSPAAAANRVAVGTVRITVRTWSP